MSPIFGLWKFLLLDEYLIVFETVFYPVLMAAVLQLTMPVVT